MSEVNSIVAVEEHARAFVVRMHERWSPADAEGFSRRLQLHGIERADDLDAMLARANAWFDDGPAHLTVWGGKPCRERARHFDGLLPRFRALSNATGCTVSVTECQGEVQTGSEAFRPYSILELRPVRTAGRGDVP